jgi:DNA-binding transcriptional ArsR family regulator
VRGCEYVVTADTMGDVPRSRSSAGRAAAQHPDELSESQVAAAVTAFALLSDPTRVRMLWALREAKLDVASLAGVAGCRPTVASQHLSKLRFAGLVEGRREGQRVVYRLRGGHVRALLTEALFHADHQVSGAPVHD